MIIDCHTHIGKMGGKVWTPQDLLARMDEAGIDYSILIAFGDKDEASGIKKVLEECSKNDRLIAVGNVDFPTFNEEQLESLKSFLKEGRIKAVKFYLGYHKYPILEPKLVPIYEYCEQNKYPVIFHTGVLEVGHTGLLKYSYPLSVDEVADKFPNLKIIIAHMGNPWIVDCAAVMLKNKNVYMDFSAYFTEYAPIRQAEVDFFVKQLSEVKFFLGDFKKCLFGTDWPLYSQKEYLNAVQKLPMTDEEKELVFWKNAKEIFNLKI